MADEGPDSLDRYREAGLKVLLFVLGLGVFVFGFIVGLRTWTLGAARIISDGGVALGSFLFEFAAFLWTARLYVTSTERGLRLLARFPPYRGRLTRTR